ncbi:MAG: OadG family protein [Ruminococcus sp.]|nr:OadG family protein [Ruminococcus sp.]
MNDIILAVASESDKLSIGESGVTAIFGYLVVFSGLALLMALIYIVGAIFIAKDKKAKAAAEAAKAAEPAKAEAPKAAQAKLAPGSAGHIKLYDVPDKEAAMVMAIVADKMQKPLNELHFISIKEVK